ncbi:MAG: threonine/serine exporter family protein, partial [Clostridiales bacterium]|nr:threonine/serine exporter family protein [Clostridiales bacterium]
RDTITGDLISGGARGAEAILRALTLGAGIGIVISVAGASASMSKSSFNMSEVRYIMRGLNLLPPA